MTLNKDVLPLIEAQITINRISNKLQEIGIIQNEDLSPNNHLDTILLRLGINTSDLNYDKACNTLSAYSSLDTPAKAAATSVLEKLTSTLS